MTVYVYLKFFNPNLQKFLCYLIDFQYSQTREGTGEIKIIKHLEFFLRRVSVTVISRLSD